MNEPFFRVAPPAVSDAPAREPDRLFRAMASLADGNPPFDQILWDPELKVLSLRYPTGFEGYVNMWVESWPENVDRWCVVDRNGGPAAGSQILWEQ